MVKTMTFEAPTIEEWDALYKITQLFKELACWEWMADIDMFGICNPEDGRIGYCSVLGNAQEVFGLIVFQGIEGLRLNAEWSKPRMEHDPSLAAANQHFLSLSLSDRAELWPQDLNVIKQLGLKFRGRQQWPLFRSYRPGFVPWFLEGWEARQLSVTLLLAMDIAKRVKESPGSLTGPVEDSFMVMVAREEEGSLIWQGQWLDPAEVEESADDQYPDDEPLDPAQLERIKQTAEITDAIWEWDFIAAPFMVKEGDRPFFPILMMIVDSSTMLVLHFHMADPVNYRKEFKGQSLDLIQRHGIIPHTIKVSNEESHELLAPVAVSLGFTLARVKKLKALEKARRSLLERFEGKS